MSGSGRVLGATLPVTGGALLISNGNGLITLAASVAAGLVAWGVIYATANR